MEGERSHLFFPERAQKTDEQFHTEREPHGTGIAWHHMGVHLSSKDILLRLCKER
jgi:hypothetical protein